MNLTPLLRQSFDAPCRIEIEHTSDSLHAHIEFDAEFQVHPGDEVLLHEAPADVPFGQRIVVPGVATVTRAGLLERIWTRLAARFEMNELYEVSFTDRRSL